MCANRANSNPNKTEVCGKMKETECGRNNIEKKRFNIFRCFVPFDRHNNSDLVQNCWSQQQGKTQYWFGSSFPPHMWVKASIRLKLNSGVTVTQSTCWVCRHPGPCFFMHRCLTVTIVNLRLLIFPNHPCRCWWNVAAKQRWRVALVRQQWCNTSYATSCCCCLCCYYFFFHQRPQGSCLSVWNSSGNFPIPIRWSLGIAFFLIQNLFSP